MPRRKRTKKLVVVDSGSAISPPATTSQPDWGDLPNELLTKIFKELKIDVDENGKPKSEVEKQALLNCRLMNRRWKDVTDDVLEKQCIDFWKVWKPYLQQDQDVTPTGFPHCFAVLHVDYKSAGESNRSTQIHCPPFLKTEMKMLEKSPSPTNSVCVTQEPCKTVARRSHKNWILTGVDIFGNFGPHLTSITFFKIPQIGIATFSRILSHTPNLKAMSLQNISMLKPNLWNLALSPLPNLAHLKLLEIDWSEGGEVWMLYFGILEEYKQRLETLEIDCDVWPEEFGNDEYLDYKIDARSFPMLKQLKMLTRTFIYENIQLQLPVVGILCLIDLPANHVMNFIQNPYLLDESTTTLVQLHIQFYVEGDPEDIHAYPNPLIKSYDNVKLPNVKSFTVTFPNCARGLTAVTGLLRLFPNLEQLKFIEFEDTEARESTDEDAEVRESADENAEVRDSTDDEDAEVRDSTDEDAEVRDSIDEDAEVMDSTDDEDAEIRDSTDDEDAEVRDSTDEDAEVRESTDEDAEVRESAEDDKEAVKNHLLEMQYWKVCKKLKVISVSMDADDTKPFYTHTRFLLV